MRPSPNRAPPADAAAFARRARRRQPHVRRAEPDRDAALQPHLVPAGVVRLHAAPQDLAQLAIVLDRASQPLDLD